MDGYGMKAYVSTVFVIIHLLIPVGGLECYECNSSDNPESCGASISTPISSLLIETRCRGSCSLKVETTDSETAYTRRCIDIALADGCLSLSQTSRECLCSTDLCNGNSSVKVTMTVTIATIVSVMYSAIMTKLFVL